MSWDILILDVAKEVKSVADIPKDFQPKPLGVRADVIRRIREIIPKADFSNPSWGILFADDYSIEFRTGSAAVCDCISLSVRGGGNVIPVIARLLAHLGVRAIDCKTSEFFDPGASAANSFEEWQAYRNRVVVSFEHPKP